MLYHCFKAMRLGWGCGGGTHYPVPNRSYLVKVETPPVRRLEPVLEEEEDASCSACWLVPAFRSSAARAGFEWQL